MFNETLIELAYTCLHYIDKKPEKQKAKNNPTNSCKTHTPIKRVYENK